MNCEEHTRKYEQSKVENDIKIQVSRNITSQRTIIYSYMYMYVDSRAGNSPSEEKGRRFVPAESTEQTDSSQTAS